MTNLRDIILNQSEQITHSIQTNQQVKLDAQPDGIIFAGMGGSWHAGQLLLDLNLTNLPIWIHRSYGLPFEYTDHPLVITSSYSGNTEEILTTYEAAKANGYPILVNTSGGQLEKMAQTDNYPVSKIDYPGMQPRHTTFASFIGVLVALINSGLAKDITADLTRVAAILKDLTPNLEQPAKLLADKLEGSIPVYTASDNLKYAAWNFKIQTNENAKYPAFWNSFPELNHNEMLGFSKFKQVLPDKRFHVVILRDPDDHPRVQARMDVTNKLYQDWGLEVSEIKLPGQTRLEKLFYAVTFGLWTTYHLADKNNIDPIPVEGIEDFKANLKKVAGKI